jgi:hypothetical protein
VNANQVPNLRVPNGRIPLKKSLSMADRDWRQA